MLTPEQYLENNLQAVNNAERKKSLTMLKHFAKALLKSVHEDLKVNRQVNKQIVDEYFNGKV